MGQSRRITLPVGAGQSCDVATPIRCHGKLNLWRLGDELERKVAAETERTLAAGPMW